MMCPGCSNEMMHLVLDGKLDTTVEIDVCPTCRAIWFDQFEERHLAPGATLKVFNLIKEKDAAGPPDAPFPTVLHCPRCNQRLLLTHDMQRSTRFQYWRCDAEHGRLISFVDFLREMDFVKPLSKEQIEELRRSVQTINCRNCGAAIDLATDSVCAHCGTPLSMLDLQQLGRTVDQLQAEEAKGYEPKN